MEDDFNSQHPHSNRSQTGRGNLGSPSAMDLSQVSISHTTPIDIRSRAALGSQGAGRRIHVSQSIPNNLQSPSHQSGNQMIQDMSISENQLAEVIWGTNINVREVEEKFINFLKNFQVEEPEGVMGEGTQAIYLTKFNKMIQLEQYYLDIDADHIFQFDKSLYIQLINFPSDMILYFDRAATKLFRETFLSGEISYSGQGPRIQTRIHHLRKKARMRDLNPSDINHLIAITGIVIRCSELQPEMKEAHYKCVVCGHFEPIPNEGGRIPEPQDCTKCRTKSSFELIHNLCIFSDRQYIKLQEIPESVPDGETPQTVTLVVYEELVDSVKPGDRVEVTGIFRAQSMRINARHRTLRSVFNTYLDVISFDLTSKQRFMSADDQVDQEEYITDDVLNEIMELASRPDIYELLMESIAPSIWENDDVKKGILCQLFGGCRKEFSQAGRGRFRSEINVLLVGDPSTAKSQLLKYVHNIAPRGIYTSGKGSSAVGLTASISKDPETREIVLESGALVLSDQGICCIDEFDKMDDNTKTILHEAMEQQTISIAKAGIVCQLNTRTAVLASANPVESRYNPKRSVIENIRLPPSLLSRFDLIYLMLDKANENMDRKLAEHILSLYTREYKMEIEQTKPKINRELLAKYISLARRKANPVIPADCVEGLVNAYVEMRRMGSSRNIITATPRQLESLIRISEALAKMRFADTVDKSDVEEAVRLIKVATQQAATDPTTGLIDMGLISTGITASSRTKINQLVDYIKEIMRGNENYNRRGIKFTTLYEELKKKFEVVGVGTTEAFTESEYKESLKILEEDGIINIFGNKKNPTNIKLVAPNSQ